MPHGPWENFPSREANEHFGLRTQNVRGCVIFSKSREVTINGGRLRGVRCDRTLFTRGSGVGMQTLRCGRKNQLPKAGQEVVYGGRSKTDHEEMLIPFGGTGQVNRRIPAYLVREAAAPMDTQVTSDERYPKVWKTALCLAIIRAFHAVE